MLLCALDHDHNIARAVMSAPTEVSIFISLTPLAPYLHRTIVSGRAADTICYCQQYLHVRIYCTLNRGIIFRLSLCKELSELSLPHLKERIIFVPVRQCGLEVSVTCHTHAASLGAASTGERTVIEIHRRRLRCRCLGLFACADLLHAQQRHPAYFA